MYDNWNIFFEMIRRLKNGANMVVENPDCIRIGRLSFLLIPHAEKSHNDGSKLHERRFSAAKEINRTVYDLQNRR